MNKIIIVALFAAVQIWTVSARAKAAPPTTTQASVLPNLDELISRAQENFKEVSEHVNELLGLPKHAEGKDVFEAIKNTTENFTKEISSVADKLKQQFESAKTGEVADTIKSVQDKLEKQVESLKKELESPEVKSKTKEIQENFTKSLNVIVEEAKKLSKTIAPDSKLSDDLQKLSKQVVDEAVKAADQLQKSIQNATSKSDAAHKH